MMFLRSIQVPKEKLDPDFFWIQRWLMAQS